MSKKALVMCKYVPDKYWKVRQLIHRMQCCKNGANTHTIGTVCCFLDICISRHRVYTSKSYGFIVDDDWLDELERKINFAVSNNLHNEWISIKRFVGDALV